MMMPHWLKKPLGIQIYEWHQSIETRFLKFPEVDVRISMVMPCGKPGYLYRHNFQCLWKVKLALWFYFINEEIHFEGNFFFLFFQVSVTNWDINIKNGKWSYHMHCQSNRKIKRVEGCFPLHYSTVAFHGELSKIHFALRWCSGQVQALTNYCL